MDLFSKIQKFGRSGRRPSSVGLAVVRRSLSAFHVDVVNSFHVYVRIFRASRDERFFMWYVGSCFEPHVVRCDLFVGPGFDSRAQPHVSRPVGSVAYVTRPHEWSIRWHRKQKKPLLKEIKKLVCMGSGPVSCGAVEGDLQV